MDIPFCKVNRTVEQIASTTKDQLDDISKCIKPIVLEDLKKLPLEKLKQLDAESLYLLVTLNDAEHLVELWDKGE
ncbi:unnamed protein product [marine sediment metagenome]|uniref:Uncharacterized protein n=1 Tax=marine sediment metagenome TaxID=412755 RepID=X1IJC6_9ZZZZ